jgi:hypothetical protein
MHSASRLVLETNGKELLSLVVQLLPGGVRLPCRSARDQRGAFSLSLANSVEFRLSSPHESANRTEVALPAGGFPLGRLSLECGEMLEDCARGSL